MGYGVNIAAYEVSQECVDCLWLAANGPGRRAVGGAAFFRAADYSPVAKTAA